MQIVCIKCEERVKKKLEKQKTGPKEQRLKLKGDWQALIGKALQEKAPEEGMAEAMTRAAGLVLVLFLLGCAQTEWKHPTKSEDDYHKDFYACEKDRIDRSLGRGEGKTFFGACMRAKGWRER